MNDFTKEELIEIYWKFEHYYDELEGLVEENPLMLKIQSLIDNYCEHVFIFILNDSSIHCHKCGKNLNERERSFR